LRRYGHSKFDVTRGTFATPILGEREVVAGHRLYHVRKSDVSFLQALHSDHYTISDHSVAMCHRMSATFKSMGQGTFGQNFGVLHLE